MEEVKETGCCPIFNPDPWEDKTHVWTEKKFIKETVCTFMYMPLNFSRKMTKLVSLAEKEGLKSNDGFCLSEHRSMWSMDLLFAVDKEIPSAKNITLSGTFYSMVFEGNFNQTGVWMKEFEQRTKDHGFVVENQYLWYTTCPRCAKEYGKNYVVVIGKIKK